MVFTLDKIILKDMQFFGYHGVLPEETTLGQEFFVDMELYLDLNAAGKSDNRDDTVNYAEVFRLVREIVEGPPRNLIEAVAESIATAVLECFPVCQVRVTVKKPSAPVPGHFAYMAVEITRTAGEDNNG